MSRTACLDLFNLGSLSCVKTFRVEREEWHGKEREENGRSDVPHGIIRSTPPMSLGMIEEGVDRNGSGPVFSYSMSVQRRVEIERVVG